MEIPTTAIKELRELTSAGIMECKRALQETGCDVEVAADMLRKKGHAIAKKKEERTADQGLVESYIHTGGRIGALVEVNCESDFVARTPEFRELAHDIAMQVAATNPKYMDSDGIPKGDDSTEEDCLLLQPFIKDPQKTINDLLAETVGKVRENIRIRRFSRFELGVEGKDA